MINIRLDKPVKLKTTPLCKQSAFLSFEYDNELVKFVSSLGTRVYLPETKEWEIPATSVAKVCNTLKDRTIHIEGKLEKEIKGTDLLPVGFNFKTEPYKHQIDGVLYGLSVDSFLLGDEQGLGKTKLVIDLAVAKKVSEGIKHCLIICGVNGLKYNWVEEVAKHSNEKAWVLGTRYTKRAPVRMVEGNSKDKLDDLNNLPDAFFIITNIETLRQMSHRNGKKYVFPIAEKIQELCENGEISMVAVDEFHKSKNPTSLQGRALLKIKPKYAIPMSGTFLMNSPLDLFMPLTWAGYEQHTYYAFQNYYCKMGGFQGREVTGYKNLDKIQELMSSAMLRRAKTEVLDLPPKVFSVEYVDMSTDQKKIYAEVLKSIRENINKVYLSSDPLSQLIRLRQATGYPGILSDKITESAKMDRLVEIVEDVAKSGGKSVVFSQWEKMTSVVKEKLKQFNPAYITGLTASEDRMNEVRRFQTDEDCSVIIGTIGAMGTGLTLTKATDVIFLDEPWNRALKDQAEDRAHRVGTTSTVRIVTLIAKNTIDERIMDIVQSKGRMSDLIVDGKVTPNNSAQIIDYLLS